MGVIGDNMKHKVRIHYSIPRSKEYTLDANDPKSAREKAVQMAYADSEISDNSSVFTGPAMCKVYCNGEYIAEDEFLATQ